MDIRHVAVIDIGKTNAKVALVDLESLSEVSVRRMPNTVPSVGLYPHFDIERLWEFIKAALAELNRQVSFQAISVTTHGATAALLAADGSLAMPVLDYEHPGPDALAVKYDALRPNFSETGAPRLALGLNLGAQIHWQQQTWPEAFARTASIVTYPQYWAFRLSGVAATEVTSLGCHTDLWSPSKGDFSSMVDRLGWRGLMAPVRKAGDILGPILPELADELGLDRDVTVCCGIHDSNASLYPHLLSQRSPFSVISSGTWVIVLTLGGRLDRLDPARDCLINVNALGDPVASCRFMGGREFSSLVEGVERCEEADLQDVVDSGIMLLPGLTAGSGPFPDRKGGWHGDPAALTPAQRFAAVSLYLALMTAYCLQLTGAAGPTIVEGPFAENAIYKRMLRVVTDRPVLTGSGGATGTSIGAALLMSGGDIPAPDFAAVETSDPDGRLHAYAESWMRRLTA